jgi:tetratricopeptide (TPR) repeat protein
MSRPGKKAWCVAACACAVAWTAHAASPLGVADRETADAAMTALLADPFALEPFAALTKAYARGPGLRELAEDLRKKATGHAGASAALVILGRVELLQGRRAEGTRLLEKATDVAKDPAAQRNLAALLDGAGDRSVAIDAYRAGLADASPLERRHVLLRVGILLLASGKAKDARAEWDQAEKEAPTDLVLRRQIAEALGAQGDYAGAIAELRGMEQLTAADPDALVTLLRRQVDFARASGDVALAQNRLVRAYTLAATSRRTMLRTELWQDLLQLRGRKGLKELLVAARAAEGKDPAAAGLTGEVLVELGDTAAAVEAFQRALATRPRDSYVLRRLCAIKTGDARLVDLQKLYDAEPEEAALAVELTGGLFAAKRSNEATGTAMKAADRFSDNAVLLVEIAELLAKNGQHAQAASLYERALARDPDRSEAVIAYADELRQLGREDDAVATYWRLVSNEASLPAYQRLIDVLRQRSLTAQVRRAYEEALRMPGPNDMLRRDFAMWLGTTGADDEALTEWRRLKADTRDRFLKDYATREVDRIERDMLLGK